MSITKLYHPTTQHSMSRGTKMNVREALQRAHSNETDDTDTNVENVLTAELDRIWSRILAQPTTYTMDQTEFGVFNRYRAQARFQNETARKAIERYWNSRSTGNSQESNREVLE